MADMELLTAIGNLLDTKLEVFERKMDAKLEVEFSNIYQRLNVLEKKVEKMEKLVDIILLPRSRRVEAYCASVNDRSVRMYSELEKVLDGGILLKMLIQDDALNTKVCL